MELKDMLKNIDYLKLYEHLGVQQLKESNKAGQYTGLCAFHNDTERSLSINTTTGQWNCFAGCGSGNIITYIAKKYNVINDDVVSILRALTEPIEISVQKFHNLLLSNSTVLNVFMKERGLSLEIIKRFKIGYDGDYFMTPIYLRDVLVNIKFYKLGKAKLKHYSYYKKKKIKVKGEEKEIKIGYGDRKLFPYENMFKGDDIFIFEGEMDCLNAITHGLNAVTSTTGASSFNQYWGNLFAGKNVYICYDIDIAGQNGAEKTAMCLREYAKKIQIINLPIAEPKNGDFTDYMINHSIEDFKSLLTDAKNISLGTEKLFASVDTATISNETVLPSIDKTEITKSERAIKTDLKNSSSPDFNMKKIQLRIVISGKDLTPFLIPYKVQATCQKFSHTQKDLKRCRNCSLAKVSGGISVKYIKQNDPVILKFIISNDFQNKGYLREFFEVPKNCPEHKIEVIQNQNIEEVRAIPEIDFIDERDSEYVSRTLYSASVTGKRLRSNTSYTITGYAMPIPRNQYATIVFDKAEHKQTDIDAFVMNDKIKKSLEIFQAEPGKVKEKLDEIHKVFEYNITQIYGRADLLTGVDLVYFSVLEFNFLNSFEHRGYVEGIFVGDTETGKSKTVERMQHYYKLGEIISGKGTTPAGLIGGLSSVANRWHLQWGKYPLNDRKMLIIDEFGGLTEDTIAELTKTRSSGIAEIVRVITERTRARVRLLGLANPRVGDKVNNYNYGVLIIKGLIGKAEDIRRFDFGMILSESDVDLNKYDVEKLATERLDNPYTSDLNNMLLRWTWSRNRDHIKFTKEATHSIMEYSKKLSDKYSSIIPLVAKMEQRIKLARMAAATACRLFSCDETGNEVIVKQEHVTFVYDFLNKIYDKPNMGYDLFSRAQSIKNDIGENEIVKLIAQFKAKFPYVRLRDIILDSRYFGKGELLDMSGMGQTEGKEFFKWCSQNRLIRGASGKFKATPIFIKVLKHKDVLNDEEILEENQPF